ncbi:MAG: beta-lactamase family protein [Desulfobacterales bacterium]|nr:beta-lactamase family protein [Desulfobacterales bacterium]
MKIFHLSCSKKIFCILTLSLFSFLTEIAVCEQPKKREYWPTSGWRSSTPEMQGMDSAKLLIADEFIQNRLPDAFSLLVVKNGYLVFEKYYSWGSPEKYAVVHSVTKSVTSALIGIALDKGYLKSVDQKLIEFFPEYITDDLDPRKKEISLKHLLTMSAGFRWNDRGPVMGDWYTSSNWAKFTIQLPQENNPGEVFNYNSSTSHLLSIILSKSTKTSTLDFAKQNLFEPLGIQSAYWHQGPQGYYIGGFGLGLSARDLAKIGFLYLNNGYWNGQSIVSEYWVKESADQQIQAVSHPIYGTFGYGYQWWVKKVDDCSSFRAWGRRGQFIVIVPELDLVIAVTSKTAQPHPPTSIHYSPLFDLVAASVKRKRPPKKPLKAVELPTDVKAFITDYDQASFNKDVVTMADLISDRFLHDGVTKQMALRFLSGTLSYTSEAKIIITKFEPEGDEAKIDVLLKDKYFEAPFMTGSKLIKENGHWKWYGNQIPK